MRNNCVYADPKGMIADAVQNKRVQRAIHRSAMNDSDGAKNEETYQRSAHKHEGRALYVIKRMSATIMNITLRITGYLILRILSFLVDGIHMHRGQAEMVRQAAKRDVPIILVPLHRSHLDYLLMSLTLFINEVPCPFIAAGDNLNIPVLGWWFRQIGAFFIKRKLDKVVGKKDFVYRAALHTYMEQILMRNQNMEFFIGAIADAYILPASVSYEKIIEGNFVGETMVRNLGYDVKILAGGYSKKKESIFSPIIGLWNAFHSSFGHIRVNFAQPFSLKEYLESAQRVVPIQSELSMKPRLEKAISDNSLYGTDVVLEDQRQLIRGLGEHIILDSQDASSIMSTNLLSFLLLTKHRRGTTMKQLQTDFDIVKEEVTSRRRDVGFSGETSDVIKHAMNILGPKLVKSEMRPVNPDVIPSVGGERGQLMNQRDIVVPNTSLPNVFELSYYANTVVSVFVMESVVANAVVSLVGDRLVTIGDTPKKSILISKSKVMQKAEELCDMLQFEFTFTRPCENLLAIISDALEDLVVAEVLVNPKNSNNPSADSEWARRIAKSSFWDEDTGGEEEENSFNSYQTKVELEVAATPEALERLQYFQRMLGPLIEGYWLSSCNLVRLLDDNMSEAEFSSITNSYAKERIFKGLATYGLHYKCLCCNFVYNILRIPYVSLILLYTAESCAMDTLRNSWKVFAHWEVISYYYKEDKTKMVQLQEGYRTEDQLSAFIDKIEAFKT
ncbi:putative glycerol-3-phosphate acyltransferase 1, mitochondrial [Apostichopus japonicus]|uniref:Putative glycerol-3-phosphate acyltransferase 1, mitochondrial n=1 Tax=Stichopus japonicus TaxID=307972 RepID=A0A2G8K7V9_STIJA|nr:putative glycerol-3-phosphate acyltransferase 1, mitochondrial [Apostichopus japonicus]